MKKKKKTPESKKYPLCKSLKKTESEVNQKYLG